MSGNTLNDIIKNTIEEIELLDFPPDSEFFKDGSLAFDDVTIVPSYLTAVSSRKDVDVLTSITDIHGNEFRMFPVMGASMSFMGETVARELAEAGGIHILPRVEWFSKQRVKVAKTLNQDGIPFGMAIGARERMSLIDQIFGRALRFLSIDVAHGASAATAAMLKALYHAGFTDGVIVGNVGSPSGALFIEKVAEKLGYNSIIIKVGVGPGAACTTRVKTGVGVGQYSAVRAVYEAISTYGGKGITTYIISDGGVEKPADFVKALAAGADAVMMGKYLTSPDFDGEITMENGQKYFTYYGMASTKAKHGASDYVEGDIIKVPVNFKNTGEAVRTLEYGLRSAMTYVNAKKVSDIRRATVISNSYASVIEGQVRGEQ